MGVEENKAVIRRLAEALNADRADAGLELWAEDLRWNGQPIRPQAIAQMRAPLWAAVPDIRVTLGRVIAEGDWVAAHWTLRGTHAGAFAHPAFGAAPASGRAIELAYLDHYRIVNGQIAEAWEVRDALSLLQQLGVFAPPGATSTA